VPETGIAPALFTTKGLLLQTSTTHLTVVSPAK
jgi:hypothetical protein